MMSRNKHIFVSLLVLASALFGCRGAREDALPGLPTVAERAEVARQLRAQYDDFATAHAQLEKAPVSGFVLIPHGVMLHSSEARARAAGGKLPVARSGAERSPRFDVSPYQVIEDRGDVVEVAFMSASQLVAHCVSEPVHPLASRLDLRAWVHKKALLPMLAASFVRTFEDRSAYGFLPGAPVWPASASPGVRYIVGAHGLQVALEPQADQELPGLMLSYSELPMWSEPTDEVSLPDDATLWIGREPLMRASELSPLLRRIRQQRAHDSQTAMVALSDSCVQVAALTPRSQVARAQREQLPAMMLLGTLGSPGGNTAALLTAQTPLFWPDGTAAGALKSGVKELPGTPDPEASERSGMRCVEVPLDLAEPLCTGDVKEPK